MSPPDDGSFAAAAVRLLAPSVHIIRAVAAFVRIGFPRWKGQFRLEGAG